MVINHSEEQREINQSIARQYMKEPNQKSKVTRDIKDRDNEVFNETFFINLNRLFLRSG